MRDSSGNRLDPVRLRGPRPRSLLRYAVIAALLALAAAVLFIEPTPGTAGRADCAARTGRSAAAKPSGGPVDRRTRPLPVPRGQVGVPIQLAEPATAAVLRPGDRVDVLARTGRAGGGTPSASPETAGPSVGDRSDDPDDRARDVVLARNVLVLAVNTGPGGSPDEGLVYLAIPKEQAQQVATTAPEVAIGVTVRPG